LLNLTILVMNIKYKFDNESDEVLERALQRLNYNISNLNITLSNKEFTIDGDFNENQVKEEVYKTVYNEKIYLETLDIRKKIFSDL
jgi:hypothetical protein